VLSLGHIFVRGVDFLVAHLQAINFGARGLETLVDQFVDDLLAHGRLMTRRRIQLGALLDVVDGDRRSVRNHHDLRANRRRRSQDRGECHACHPLA